MELPIGFVDPVAIQSVRVSLAVLLLVGGGGKLRNGGVFRDAVVNYKLLPVWLIAPFALLFMVAETTSGLLLMFNQLTYGSIAAMGVIVLASMGVVVNLARGRNQIDCGCGGSVLGATHAELSWILVVRNVVLFALAMFLLAPPQVRVFVWLDVISSSFFTIFLLGLNMLVNQLLSNQPRLNELRHQP